VTTLMVRGASMILLSHSGKPGRHNVNAGGSGNSESLNSPSIGHCSAPSVTSSRR
jgi:hypothetical protein